MPQPDKRSALHVLTKVRLRELVDLFELKLAAAESKDAQSTGGTTELAPIQWTPSMSQK